MQHQAHNSNKARVVVSLAMEDGRLIETVHRPAQRVTALIQHFQGETTEAPSFEVPELGTVTPYSPTNNLLTHSVVLFPSDVGTYADVRSLVTEVRSFIHRYADLSDAFEEVASYYVLLSWVHDAFNEIPYLRLKGDFGSGKSRCLLTIGAICYKPMFVSGASTVSPMFRIIDAFRGTLVLDESDFRYSDEKAEIVKILNNGSSVGFPVLRSEQLPTKEFNPRAFAVFGPKIIASRSVFQDKALESRCITHVMTGARPREDIPISLPASFENESLELRNKLLAYRFAGFMSVRTQSVSGIVGVEPRIAQIFGALLAVVDDPEARRRIIELAEQQSAAIRSDREASVDAQILDIMVGMRRDGVGWAVKDIAERFASRYGSEYERAITPRWVGTQLRRRLSLTPVKTNGTFIVPDAQEARVRGLLERYGIPVDIGTSA